jgi:hypothetical protein
MKEQGPATWIEQHVAELEGNLAAWKAEMQSHLAAGTEPDTQALAKMEVCERELKGLKSLRDIRGSSREV